MNGLIQKLKLGDMDFMEHLKSIPGKGHEGMYDASLIAEYHRKNIEDWLKLEETKETIVYMGVEVGSVYRLKDGIELEFKMFEENLFPETIRFIEDGTVLIRGFLLPCLIRWVDKMIAVCMDIELVEDFEHSQDKDLYQMIGYYS